MEITVDLNLLKKYSITADEYVFLYLVHKKCFEELVGLGYTIDINRLQNNGLLKVNGESFTQYQVRAPFFEISDFDSQWAELLSYYPIKVSQGNIERVVRIKDPDALGNKKLKEKYKKILKTEDHEVIVAALKTELAIKKRSDSLGYMKLLSTWLNNYEWEKYIGLEESNSNDGRITRKLS